MSNWNSIPFNISNFRKKIKSLLLNVLGNEDDYLNVNYLIEYFSIGNSMICSDIWHKYHE